MVSLLQHESDAGVWYLPKHASSCRRRSADDHGYLGAISRMGVNLTEAKVRAEDACGVFCYAIWDIAEDARGAWLDASCSAASGDASDAQSAQVQPMGFRVLRGGLHAAVPRLGATDGTSRELRREELVGEKGARCGGRRSARPIRARGCGQVTVHRLNEHSHLLPRIGLRNRISPLRLRPAMAMLQGRRPCQ